MPVALLHPGVYIEEVSSGVRTIAGVSTSTALFIGWAPRGPVDRAVRITSFADFETVFGGLDARSLLGYSVRQFYDNGGSDAYILRIANAAVVAKTDLDTLKIKASSPGLWANSYGVRVTRRTDDATRFTLDVIKPAADPANDVMVETFPNLSINPTDPRFAPSVVNGRSNFIDGLEASGATTPVNARELLGKTTAGTDGTVVNATSANFLTQLAAAFGVGGFADRIDLFNLVCVPGLVDGPAVSALEAKVRARRAFLILDCGPNDTASTVAASLANKTGADAQSAAFYFPWVLAPDPLQENALRAFPPCGFMAGLYARTNSRRGVWKAPAGTEAGLTGAAGLTVTLSDAENGQLNPRAINCLRTMPVYGNIAWGARTLDGDDARGSEWKYVPVRRTALFIEESLYRGTQWVVFEPNDEPLWAQIRLNIGAFMQGLFRQGAFQGTTPKQAYFVKCDRETTTQADINLGIVNILVGFAPLKPAEFVVLKIQQIAGDLAA